MMGGSVHREDEKRRGRREHRHEEHRRIAFAIAFKGVFSKASRWASIVLTFGANQHRIGLDAAAAASPSRSWFSTAVRSPLRPWLAPENSMK